MDVNEVGNRETKLKVIEANSWFIEKSYKMDKPLSRQKKKNRWGIHKLIISERWATTTHPMDAERATRDTASNSMPPIL